MCVNYFCRGCKNYKSHKVIDTRSGTTETGNPNTDYTKLQCIHCKEEPFIVKHDKGKPATEYSTRVEVLLANPEE